MLRLAVCDDEEKAVEQIQNLIRDFLRSRPDILVTAEPFTSSQALCGAVEAGRLFDIFLLDVEMPAPDGLETAAVIQSRIPSAVILFLTSHTEFPVVQESFKVRPLRYISKLNMETTLPEALEAAFALCREKEPEYLTLTWYHNALRVPLDDIRLIRRVGRVSELATQKHGTLYDRRSLKELLSVLGDNRFCLTGKSTVVNLEQVLSVSEDGLSLKSGETVAVSRKMLPGVKKRILNLWGKGNDRL